MQATHCPFCSTPLEVRQVAPCWDCGHMPRELEELARGEHRYAEYRVWGLTVVLCDFCDADFGSYLPSYFGLATGERTRLGDLEFVRDVAPPPVPCHDKYCPECEHRLAFLKFRCAAIEHNRKTAG